MSRVAVRRPSAALIVSIVALAVALGGTSYAAFNLPKNSVGTKQLRNGAVSTTKLKNGAVTKAKLDVTGVTVPDAVFANSAGSATSASSATTATNAANLGGSPAAAFRDHCPSATTLAAANVCVTNADVGTGGVSGSGYNTWDGALHDCAALGMQLPTPSQALLLVPIVGTSAVVWTDDFWVTGSPSASYALYEANDDVFQALAMDILEVRCVTTPSNS